MIVLALFASYRIANSISQPIKEAVVIAEDISELNLTKDVAAKDRERKDEIGNLMRAYQLIITKQRSFLNKLKDIVSNSGETSEAIVASIQEVAGATEEIALTVEQIASGASEQAQEAGEVVSLAHVLEEKLDKMLVAFNKTLESTRNMKHKNERGIEAVADVKEKFALNTQAAIATSKSIEDVIEKSQSI